ncbi:Aste57867_15197 [Aphanomyces stellatus]|uniref:Aste57867_15197 protein n=1 Tax=Aphanomyces stellatus TaxID=120398 RepID=A0A485L5G5_9STRA|nr:hypothetical protein As57867_015141 [Aphanomyces stellatus]VFT92006.1 Aste57867_15197 [Aphanomyces stellatus]
MQVTYPILGVGQAKNLIAICGGGGSAKTGVKNTVDVYAMPTRGKPYRLLGSADTGSELASSVAISADGTWLAVSVNAACWVYEAKPKSKETPESPDEIELVFRVKFRTDFADESSQTCACFVDANTLLTGGEDSVIRHWTLTHDVEDAASIESAVAIDCSGENDGKTLPAVGDRVIHGSTVATLTREYRGHTKRIKQIHVDNFSRNMVVTSDEAASCHLWRLDSFDRFFAMHATESLKTVFTKYPAPKGVHKHQFRCVRFATNGQSLYTVLSPPRGDAYLVKWVPETPSQVDTQHWAWRIDKVTLAGPEPVGSLCISDDSQIVRPTGLGDKVPKIATATASGDIFAFSADRLAPVSRTSQEDHTFAITGLTCQVAAPGLYRLCSAGADKRLLLHRLETQTDGLSWFGTLFALVVALVAGAVATSAALLYFHASQSLLPQHPLQGVEDLLASEFETNDAMATVMAGLLGLLTTLVSWILCLQSKATHALFWAGLASLVLSGLSLYVAAAADMQVQWQTEVDLVEYKTCIVSAVAGVLFLLLHSLGLMLL